MKFFLHILVLYNIFFCQFPVSEIVLELLNINDKKLPKNVLCLNICRHNFGPNGAKVLILVLKWS